MMCCRALKIWAILISVACLATAASAATTIYVDDDANGSNNGGSWENAYNYLQDALSTALFSPKPVEILVAQGTYKPDRGMVAQQGNREEFFRMRNQVSLKGGYAGVGAPNPDLRDIEQYETILSGDLEGDDMTSSSPLGLVFDIFRWDNSYSVVVAVGVDDTAVLDGFTITAGYADEFPNAMGGGMAIVDSSAVVRNCIFEDNFAGSSFGTVYGVGGGMYNEESNPTIENCIFRKNSVDYMVNNSSLAALGAGMFNYASNPTVIGCTFDRNSAYDAGAGMFNANSSPELIECTFNANLCLGFGGAMFNDGGSPKLDNCMVTINTAAVAGGMFCDGSRPVMTNCTFGGNTGIFRSNTLECDSGGSSSRIEFVNSIIWDGSSEAMVNNDGSQIIVKYSDVQGGRSGTGNINVNPQFANPGVWNSNGTTTNVADDTWTDGDYHLKSEFGRWVPGGSDPNDGSWVTDDITSACIDAGDPASPVGDEPAANGGIVNMGAYGGTWQASKSEGGDGGDDEPEKPDDGDDDDDEEPSGTLGNIMYLYSNDEASADSFEALLEDNGATVTTMNISDLGDGSISSYDLIIVGNDTGSGSFWGSPYVAKVNNTGIPIIGLGRGGYAFFGKIALNIGYPNGRGGSSKSISVLRPNSSIFATPIHITIPESEVLELYTMSDIMAAELPSVPSNVVTLGSLVNDNNVYPLVTEDGRYMLWAFTNSPSRMTQTGKDLFVNAVVYMSNAN